MEADRMNWYIQIEQKYYKIPTNNTNDNKTNNFKDIKPYKHNKYMQFVDTLMLK